MANSSINSPAKHHQRIECEEGADFYLRDCENDFATGTTRYYKRVILKSKRNHYLRTAISIALMNMLIIIHSSGQLVTLSNVNISNSSQITVSGDIMNTAGATISNEGIIDLSGDFTNNSGNNLFGTSAGNVILNGADQYIGGTDITRFHDLSLFGTGTKTLQQDISVGGAIGSPNGVLSLGMRTLDLNSNEITITNPANTAITRISGYIVSETGPAPGYGIMRWEVKNNAGNYVFPFGNAITNSYLPVTVEINTPGTGANGSLSLSTYPTITSATPNNRPLPAGLTSLMDNFGNENAQNVVDRWWMMDASGFSTMPVSSITLTYRDSEWDASAGSTNNITESALQAQSGNGSVWSPAPMGAVNTVLNTVTINNINFYHPLWTLVASSNPLPIELLTFNAELNKYMQVELDWATATEINNDFFTLEKSKDGISFDAFAFVDGAGNSGNILYYRSVDKEPFDGITYYRLKQTDFDGQFSYSEIKAVRIEKGSESSFTVFPNPATDHFFVKFDNTSGPQSFFIIDMNGKVVREIALAGEETAGKDLIKVDRSGLDAGMYFVTLYEGKMQKLVLQ